MSSGPDIVHDDEDVGDSADGLAVFLVALPLSCRRFRVLVGSFSFRETVDAITQDSPRAERSGVRGCSVDMA